MDSLTALFAGPVVMVFETGEGLNFVYENGKHIILSLDAEGDFTVRIQTAASV